jgi:nitrogen regulatory protein P-II 1
MKKIEAIIKPFKLDEVKEALHGIGIRGITAYEIRVSRRRQSETGFYRGAEYVGDFVPKMKIEMVIEDSALDQTVETLQQAAYTGHSGDGRMFISSIDDVIRIRTGERGAVAL